MSKPNLRRGKGRAVWKRLWHYYFHAQKSAFMAHYHRRSNVESTFTMITHRYGSAIRAKTEAAK